MEVRVASNDGDMGSNPISCTKHTYRTREVPQTSNLPIIVRVYVGVQNVSEAHTGERLPVKQRGDSSILSRNANCGVRRNGIS